MGTTIRGDVPSDGWDLRPLLHPRSVAIVGASPRPDSVGSRLLGNLLAGGYKGDIRLVSKRHRSIGRYACAAEVSEVVDSGTVVLIGVPHDKVLDVVADAISAGAAGAIVYSSGFKEVDENGAREERELAGLARSAHFPIVGPNCMGVMSAWGNMNATFSTGEISDWPTGDLALVAQSGALTNAIRRMAIAEGIGFSYVINSGNEAVLDVVDYMEALALEDHVGVLFAYIEGIRRGRELLSAVGNLRSRGIDAVVLLGGKGESGARAALSHTGSLASPARVSEAVLAQAGVVMVDSLAETVAVLKILAHRQRLQRAETVGIVSTSGGTGVLSADAAEANGLTVLALGSKTRQRIQELLPSYASARNPVDITSTLARDAGRVAEVLEQMAEAPVDVVTFSDGMVNSTSASVATATAGVLARSSKFGLVGWYADSPDIARIYRDAGVPYFTEIRQGFAALAKVVEARKQRVDVPPHAAATPSEGAVADGADDARVITEPVIEGSLRAAGVVVVDFELAASSQDAVRAAGKLGLPVVLKAVSPDLPHRGRIGAIAVGVSSLADVEKEFRRIEGVVAAHAPQARVDGQLVQKLAARGVELYVGIKVDPAFGPVIGIGAGGAFVEAASPTSFALVPLVPGSARLLVDRVPGMSGALGETARDSVTEFLVKVSQWWCSQTDLGRVLEVDLNPVVVGPDGPVVVDALGLGAP